MKTQFSRRTTLKRLIAGLLGASVPKIVVAQPSSGGAWLQKPIRLIVPFPAGGTADALGRVLAQRLADVLGTSVVVDNRPGAGGNVGADAAAKSAPDGSTLFMGTNGTHGGINTALYAKLPYDPVKDFAPIALQTVLPSVLVVNNALPVKNVAELVAYLKANAGKVNYGSAGNGTTSHLAAELFKRMAGVEMTHVPYRGGAAAMTDVIGGQVQLMFETATNALAQSRGGKVRALGVTLRTKFGPAPELVPVADTVKDFEVVAWTALYAPANTPREIVGRLAAEMAKLSKTRDYIERLTQLGVEVPESSPDQLASFMQLESTRWGRVVKESGAKLD